MKIYLTRHGQTEWNKADRVQGIMDSPLTQEGIEMAEVLRKTSKNIKFDKVYSSDLKRAEDTAKIIAPENEIVSTPYLREIDVGNWSGRYFNTLKEEDRELYTTYFNEPHKYKREDGESLYEVMDRVEKFFEEYILNSEDENVLIVSHGVTIVAILNYVEKIDIENFWDNRVLRNATFNIVEYTDGEFKVLKKAPKNPVATI